MQIVNWPRAFAFPIALRLSPAKRQRGVNLRLPPSPPLFYNYVLGFSDSCFFCVSLVIILNRSVSQQTVLFPIVIQFYCELSIYFLFNS